jgi:hypothetical protein
MLQKSGFDPVDILTIGCGVLFVVSLAFAF